MKQPKDHIIFPLDVSEPEEAKKYVKLLSGKVGMFKVGLELFLKGGPDIIHYIKQFDDTQIFLDLKLHDIPETVYRAVRVVAELGVRFLTVHCAESAAMVKKAVDGSQGKVDILGVTILTSVGPDDIAAAGFKNLYSDHMTELVKKRAEMAQKAGCKGIVCSGLEVKTIKNRTDNTLLVITPGIRPAWSVSGADDQKRVTTPARAIQNGADYLVIGRPIRDADNPVAAAEKTALEIADAL